MGATAGVAGCGADQQATPAGTATQESTEGSPTATESTSESGIPEDIVADTVTANKVTTDRFTTVRGTSFSDIQTASENYSYINLQAGEVYEGDSTITLSVGGGPEGQKQFIDARGAKLNYTGDGKRAIEFLPPAELEGLPKSERNYENRASYGYHWVGGSILGPGRNVENSAAIYAEDLFGSVIRPMSVAAAENGIWVRNKMHWSEANDLAITGRGGGNRTADISYDKDTGIGWGMRLDGGPASDDLSGTLSYRTSDVSIFWQGGDLGYLWLNGASMHGGTIQIRGFLGDTADGLRITGGGWNMSAMAHLEWEGGTEDARPVYIGPNANPPLFVSPRIGHPSDGHFSDPENTIVNESDNPALCLMHDGIYNEYTEKLIGFKEQTPSFGSTPDTPGMQFRPQNLYEHWGNVGEVGLHDGSDEGPMQLFMWDDGDEVWSAIGADTELEPTVEPETEAVDATITIQDDTFDPHTVEIEPGQTVAWVNEDDHEHHLATNSIHSDQLWTENAEVWAIDEALAPGDRVTNTFPEAGVFEFQCNVHGQDQMCGAVSVGGVPIEGSMPCE
jgi:plastocyanin